ncbi:MAG: AAA family ATPase [Lachnospiraceae bacterium]|nr:AAA family ATPase [Lachnospiraceae bacterium]
MAKVIAIMGESGSGKTTSMRNLDPETTYYIDCDKKGLSWKGWRNQYKTGVNYTATDMPAIVKNLLVWLDGKRIDEKTKQPNTKGLKFKTVVIDTLNGIMVAEEMRNLKVNGYGKWSDLAAYIYEIIDYALVMRNDLTVIFVAHSETISDENGMIFTRIKTNGRKLDRIVVESKLTTVLLAECKDGKYIFHTHANRSTAKTPLGAFENDEIENDIATVIKELEEF